MKRARDVSKGSSESSTGSAPDVGEVLRGVRLGEFPPPRQLDRTIDPALKAICLKAMALQSDARYASTKALADDLELGPLTSR